MSKSSKKNNLKKVALKVKNYPPKILLAWGKAMSGNDDLYMFLERNGYEELTKMIDFVKEEDDTSEDWLLDNGYVHLMALGQVTRNKKDALKWLRHHKIDLYYNLALAMGGKKEGFQWIRKNSTREYLYLALHLKDLRDDLNDPGRSLIGRLSQEDIED